MKKTLKIIGISVVVLVMLYEFLGLFGVFKLYNNATTSNEPTLKLDAKMAVSNLFEVKKGDFVCYKFTDSVLGNHIRVHRLCGIENDTIEIKKGILFINGENFDSTIDLGHSYVLNRKEFMDAKASKHVTDEMVMGPISSDSFLIMLSDSFAESQGFDSKRKVSAPTEIDQEIKSVYRRNWNKDYFGPLIIPKGKIFVLGDNRDNSLDSRWVGLINHADIVGRIIYP